MTDILILWHMHQPRYVHPATGRPILPWVRLHAASGYLDMARVLERHPSVKVTVNFVPSLVEQIEAMLAGARDVLEEVADKPASDLDDAERQILLARSFSVRWDRMIQPRARFAELLAKRGSEGRPDVIAAAARRFTAQDLRDVSCLFHLAWLGFAAREDDPAIDALDTKGKAFTEDDKRTILKAVRAAAGKVLPAWKKLGARGQVELASSPFFHPIIPLLVDTETAKRARPSDALPPRFAHREDARAQILLAKESHARVFGAPPVGMWPPEGSLSPEAVSLYDEAGVKWLAGDEEVVTRSTGDGRAKSKHWRYEGVDLVFRDRELSDRIGFRYADVPAAAAAADLIASAQASAQGGICGLFLDGENAWESYPRRGEEFLSALYAKLEEEEAAGRARSRTIGESLAERGPGTPLAKLHSGSWIEGAFRIWIGDPVKNAAWTQLGRARDRLTAAETKPGADKRRIAEARRLLLAAEGSDWFWWFGEPFSSAEDPLFDELFRAHLEAAYRALGDEPPAILAEPIGTGTPAALGQVAPTSMISPKIDGRASRFYDWHGAARHEIGQGAAMADGSHPIERIFVGFDAERLYLRIDPGKADRRRVGAARLVLRAQHADHETILRILLGAADGGPELRAAGGRVGSLDVVALAIPFAALGAEARKELRLWMTFEFAGVTFARVPRDGVIAMTVPWPGWADEHWSA